MPYRKNRILAIDDSLETLMVLKRILEKENHLVTYSTTIIDILEIADIIKPDLIILDIVMPSSNGFDYCNEILKNPTTKNIPIIFLSAKDEIESVIHGLGLGAVDYIKKPFNVDELMLRVKKNLEHKEKTYQLWEANINLQQTLFSLEDAFLKISKLKTEQDADYFLTLQLTQQSNVIEVQSSKIIIDYLIKQKKEFIFEDKKYDIGGDINIAQTIRLQGKHYHVFMNADAMGKSLQGAGGAIVLGTAIRTIINETADVEQAQNLSPEDWLWSVYLQLNKIFSTFKGMMNVSTFFGILGENDLLLHYILAEHPRPVLIRDSKVDYVLAYSNAVRLGSPFIETIDKMYINKLQMFPKDILISGSDGRDDILIGDDRVKKIYFSDESFFLECIANANYDLKKIVSLVQQKGEITDDLSLLKITILEKIAD